MPNGLDDKRRDLTGAGELITKGVPTTTSAQMTKPSPGALEVITGTPTPSRPTHAWSPENIPKLPNPILQLLGDIGRAVYTHKSQAAARDIQSAQIHIARFGNLMEDARERGDVATFEKYKKQYADAFGSDAYELGLKQTRINQQKAQGTNRLLGATEAIITSAMGLEPSPQAPTAITPEGDTVTPRGDIRGGALFPEQDIPLQRPATPPVTPEGDTIAPGAPRRLPSHIVGDIRVDIPGLGNITIKSTDADRYKAIYGEELMKQRQLIKTGKSQMSLPDARRRAGSEAYKRTGVLISDPNQLAMFNWSTDEQSTYALQALGSMLMDGEVSLNVARDRIFRVMPELIGTDAWQNGVLPAAYRDLKKFYRDSVDLREVVGLANPNASEEVMHDQLSRAAARKASDLMGGYTPGAREAELAAPAYARVKHLRPELSGELAAAGIGPEEPVTRSLMHLADPITQAQTALDAAEARIKKRKRPKLPSGEVKGLGEMEAYAQTIRDIYSLVGERLKAGKEIPLAGVFEGIAKLLDKYTNWGDASRIDLRALVARLPGLMYAMRGKQLSDKELEVALDMMPQMASLDTEFLTKLYRFFEYMGLTFKAKVNAYGKSGYDVDAFQTAGGIAYELVDLRSKGAGESWGSFLKRTRHGISPGKGGDASKVQRALEALEGK